MTDDSAEASPETSPETAPDNPDGASLRGALDRARDAARGRGSVPAANPSRTPASGRHRGRRRRPDEVTFSGAGPDGRDPQLVGSLVRDLRDERGWDLNLTIGSVAGRWPELVGTDIAAHCRPERLDRGELVLVAESSAWATQLRLLAATIRGRLEAELGPGVVRRIAVHGPTGPTWRKGSWRVVGRGPRDTYG